MDVKLQSTLDQGYSKLLFLNRLLYRCHFLMVIICECNFRRNDFPQMSTIGFLVPVACGGIAFGMKNISGCLVPLGRQTLYFLE